MSSEPRDPGINRLAVLHVIVEPRHFDFVEVSPHEVVTTFRTPPDLAQAPHRDPPRFRGLKGLAVPLPNLVAVTGGSRLSSEFSESAERGRLV